MTDQPLELPLICGSQTPPPGADRITYAEPLNEDQVRYALRCVDRWGAKHAAVHDDVITTLRLHHLVAGDELTPAGNTMLTSLGGPFR